MHALGVDMSDNRQRRVVVDEDGCVVHRDDGESARTLSGFRLSAAGVATDGHRDAASIPGAPPPHVCAPGAAAVTAETWVGAAQGVANVVTLLIGDGVFAGVLLDGRPWAGAHGHAGSAAWLALNPVDRQDYRTYGSFAAEVSNKGLARRLAWRIEAGDTSAVLDRAGALDAITAGHVFEAARQGDGLALSVVRDTGKYIGMAVANLAATVDPEIVVLGGTIAAAGDLLLDTVRHECARRLPPGLADRLRIEISPLGESGVAIGAARIAMLATR